MPPRSLVFKSKVTTILSHTVISTDLESGAEEWKLNLDEDLNKTKDDCWNYFIYYYAELGSECNGLSILAAHRTVPIVCVHLFGI